MCRVSDSLELEYLGQHFVSGPFALNTIQAAHFIDPGVQDVPKALQALGVAKVIPATASNSQAVTNCIDGERKHAYFVGVTDSTACIHASCVITRYCTVYALSCPFVRRDRSYIGVFPIHRRTS